MATTLNGASKLVFATGCEFIRDKQGKFSLEWQNGTAVEAVRGAAVDYIDPKFHMAVTKKDNTLVYAPSADLDRLLKAEIKLPIALVIVGMRRICASFKDNQLNIAEVTTVDKDTCSTDIDAAGWKVVTDNSTAFNQLIDMGPTILGMNGLSLMQKGHNYLDSDSMWGRLVDAADLDTSWSKFSNPDYAGIYFHDALHPFTAEWKVKLASDVDSILVKHSNGVLVKRIPGVPAGTTLAFVLRAALSDLSYARPSVAESLGYIAAPLDELLARIRAKPLDFCAAFPQSRTRENLAKVAKVEQVAAFIYGACTVIFDKKTTILKSKSFKSNADKNAGMTSMGRGWGEDLDATPMDADGLKQFFDSFVKSLGDEDDESDEDDDDEDDDDDDDATAPGPEKSSTTSSPKGKQA